MNILQFWFSNRKSMFGGAVPPLSGKQYLKESEPKLYPGGILSDFKWSKMRHGSADKRARRLAKKELSNAGWLSLNCLRPQFGCKLEMYNYLDSQEARQRCETHTSATAFPVPRLHFMMPCPLHWRCYSGRTNKHYLTKSASVAHDVMQSNNEGASLLVV